MLVSALSAFVPQAALRCGREVLREHTEVALSDGAAERFLAALDDDGPPPAEMRELFRRSAPWEA